MQYITIKGNVGKDGEIRTVRDRDVLSFSVGVKQGYGDNTSTNWYRVQVWGKLAQTLLPRAVKGTAVVAIGDLKIGEYNGKPSFDIDAQKVEFVGASRPAQSAPREASKPAYQPEALGLDDDVPF